MGEAVALDAVPAEWTVTAERLSLRRAIANLIDNGLRHGSSVTIRVTRGAVVEIVVADDGPGVPPEMLPRLGQAFDRLDPSRDRSTGGAGLGLAIVRALMDRQGGKVNFRNRPNGGLEAAEGGGGQVELMIQGRLMMAEAYTKATWNLKPNSKAKVVALVGRSTLLVEPLTNSPDA